MTSDDFRFSTISHTCLRGLWPSAFLIKVATAGPFGNGGRHIETAPHTLLLRADPIGARLTQTEHICLLCCTVEKAFSSSPIIPNARIPKWCMPERVTQLYHDFEHLPSLFILFLLFPSLSLLPRYLPGYHLVTCRYYSDRSFW